MDAILIEFFKHNVWANDQLLDVCAGLGDEVLAASAVGTYGSLGDTLVHLVGAQERYVRLLTGQGRDTPVHESQGFPGYDRLRESARWSGDALVAVAQTADASRILSGTRHGEAYSMPMYLPLLQAINHATDHRCHIATILTQQGITPPDLDGWTYAGQ